MSPTAGGGGHPRIVCVVLLIAGGQGDISLRSDTLLGNLLVLFAAMMWAVYTPSGKPLLARYSPLKLNALTMVPGTLMLALISVPQTNQDWAVVTPGAWAAVGLFDHFRSCCRLYLVVYRGAADRRRGRRSTRI